MASYPAGKCEDDSRVPNVTGPASISGSPCLFFDSSSSRYFCIAVELDRILRFQQHHRAVIRQPLHEPLVAVPTPGDQIAPPLVRGFMGDDLSAEDLFDRTQVEIGFLLRSKE